MPIGAYDQCFQDLSGAIEQWDLTMCFPGGYTGAKSVVIAQGWPYDIIDNILAESAGVMTKPIVTVYFPHSADNFRTLGGQINPGSGSLTGHATRLDVTTLVTAWADQKLGGGETARRLGGELQGCLFYNRNRLSAYRHLRVTASHDVYDATIQMWRYDLTIEGNGLVIYYS